MRNDDCLFVPPPPQNPHPGMWYYFCDGQCVGPISQNLLISKFDLSDIPHSTLVWGTVSGEWLPVRDVLKFVAAKDNKAQPDESPVSVDTDIQRGQSGGRLMNSWSNGLAAFCILILLYGLLFSKNTVGNIFFLVGFNLTTSIVLWLIFQILFGRRRGLKKAGISYITLYCFLIVQSYLGYFVQGNRQNAGTPQEVSRANEFITDLQKQIISSPNIPNSVDPELRETNQFMGFSSAQEGEADSFDVAAAFFQSFVDKMSSAGNDYLQALDSIGWSNVLDPDRIARDKSMIESKRMISEARNILAKHKERIDESLKNVTREVAEINNTATRRAIQEGIDQSMEESVSLINSILSSEEETISEFEKIILLLESRNGKWKVQDSQILFDSQDDLSTFTMHLNNIQKLARKEEAIRMKSLTEGLHSLEELKGN